MAFDLIGRDVTEEGAIMRSNTAYRSAISVAVGSGLFVVWGMAALGVVGVITLILGKHKAEYSSVFEIMGLTGMFASLFAGSAWLFLSASAQQNRADSASRL